MIKVIIQSAIVLFTCAFSESCLFADSIEIIDKDNEAVEIEFYAPRSSLIFGDVSALTYNINDVDTMLMSTDYMNRALAATVVANGSVADTAKCVELLVNALAGELNSPSSTESALVVPGTISDFLLEQYMYDLRVLLYVKGSAIMEPYIQRSTGHLKELLILVAGLLGDKNVRDDVRSIYLGSKSGFIRFQAIQVMNIYPDILDIPVLKKALKDDYYVEDMFGNKLRFVRADAKGALIKLGYTLESIKELDNDGE